MADEIAHNKPIVSETEEARPPAPSAPSEKVNRPTGFAAPGVRTVGDPAEDPNGCVSPTVRANARETQEETDADGNIPPQSEMADEIDIDAHAERVGKTRRELEKELKKQPRPMPPPQARNEAASAGRASEVGGSGLSETARSLAKRDFEEPRWLAERALLWIAFRNSDALVLSYQDLQRRRLGESLGYGASDSIACKNPTFELLTALKFGKLKGIDDVGEELPPEFWDDKPIDLRAWPDVRFRRDDILRLWPVARNEGPPQESIAGSQEGVRQPEAIKSEASKPRMSGRDVLEKLPSFLEELKAEWELQGSRFNQQSAREAAEEHFGKVINRSRFRAVYRTAGLNRSGGRPRKTPPKS